MYNLYVLILSGLHIPSMVITGALAENKGKLSFFLYSEQDAVTPQFI